MKTFERCDLVHEDYASDVAGLVERAKKCGMLVKDVLDIKIEGEQYTKLLFTTTRWSYIKYLCIAILKGEANIGGIPSILKLMFMR